MAAPFCLAVDFGTTNTVAVVTADDGQRADAPLQRITFGDDWRLPSAVFWSADGPPVVGRNAVRSQRMDPTRFIRCPKREMGFGAVPLGGHQVPVTQIVAAVLDTVHLETVRQLGGEPRHVVLTRPVQWAATRRGEFEEAARLAGWQEAQFLEEPVGAAIRLGSLDPLPSGKPFAVLDFGGGTLDVAVVQREGAAFDVLASDGADPLGGEDIDDLVFTYVLSTLVDQGAARLLADSPDPAWSSRRTALRRNCQLAKEQLSEQDWGAVGLPHGGDDVILTRQQFDGLAGPVLQRAAGTLHETVLQCGYDPATVPVYLVGGSSRIPTLRQMIRAQMHCEVRLVGDPQFVVSEGAALWAAHRPGAQRGRMLFERVWERFPDRRAALEDAGRAARETLTTARRRALEAGGRVRDAAERARNDPRVKETGERLRRETRRLVDEARQDARTSSAVLWSVLVVLLLVVVVVVAATG
ncbi:Hsp70 family protein [Blastococcus deserti]|uniref:Hsp70 family protein n=1 Tax=Blastococcus deserti TaxID=2259033 RepID=A0ABW4XCB2_9ACTN